MLIENVTEQVVGLADRSIVFTDKNTRIIVLLAEVGNGFHVFVRDGAFIDDFIAHIAISAIHCDVSVDESPALKFIEVVDDQCRTTGGDEDLYTFFVCPGQCLDGRGWDNVCLEAYQRTVDVKKQCLRHNVPFDSVTKVKKILIFAEYKDINYGIDNRNHPIH